MSFFIKLLVLLYYFIVYFLETSAEVYYLKPGEVITYEPNRYPQYDETLQIYCYEGKPKYIIHVWQSISLQIDLKTDNFLQYDGATPEEVRKEYLAHRSSWTVNLFSWKQKHIKLDPFNKSCIGIETRERYQVYINVIRIDYWKVLCLLTGILLFICAPKLSKNTLFYYLCGVTFGICASFLIFIYFVSKLFPKRPVMYGVAVCGWTVGVYILQMLWENLRIIVTNYQYYVIWYAIITGFISFIVCYRWGPVTNERTRNLIKWSLQGVGLFAIFYSSQFQEAAMGQIVILLLAHNFPQSWLSKSRTYWKRKFPPKVHTLTNDEYYHEGVKETATALENLREYCSSPKCNQWKTVLKLKDVKRFASFVEGNSHISDGEIMDYESSIQQSEFTDDEEDLTDEDS